MAALPVYSPAPLASGAEKQAKEEQAVPFSLSGWERNFQNDDIQPITRARRPLAALPVYSPVPLASGAEKQAKEEQTAPISLPGGRRPAAAAGRFFKNSGCDEIKTGVCFHYPAKYSGSQSII